MVPLLERSHECVVIHSEEPDPIPIQKFSLSSFAWTASRASSYTSSSLLLSSLELSDTQVYEPQIRALLGTAAHFCPSSHTRHATDYRQQYIHTPTPAPASRTDCRHHYRGPSLIRNSAPLGPYIRPMPRALWWPWGGGRLFLVSEVPL